ncbi:MAG: hypothetical protein AAFR90_12050 [Pseudomonadota bacterium]
MSRYDDNRNDRPQQRSERDSNDRGRDEPRSSERRDGGSKQPSFIAYQVREGQDNKAHFNRVGAAFAHKDGQGHDILLDAMPVNGRVTLRTPQERVQDTRDKGKQSAGREVRQEPGLDYDR